jgi:hypothetical protein
VTAKGDIQAAYLATDLLLCILHGLDSDVCVPHGAFNDGHLWRRRHDDVRRTLELRLEDRVQPRQALAIRNDIGCIGCTTMRRACTVYGRLFSGLMHFSAMIDAMSRNVLGKQRSSPATKVRGLS